MSRPASRAEAVELDRADPLRGFRDRFALPEGLLYLDGNSLGPLAHGVAERVERTVREEWGAGLVRSWNDAGWIDLPGRVAAKIAPLVGARPDEVTVADSISVNLYKLLTAALEMRPGRPVVLTPPDDFPTDGYVFQGVVERLAALGRPVEIRRAADLAAAVDEEVAVVAASHVHYRTGALADMRAISAAARRAGALTLWDLAHSAGALPVDLRRAGADLAVGCGYKFLSGGPGAPSFLFVARELQPLARNPIQGWLGHAEPFAFDSAYRPAPGVDRFRAGTPPILSLAALDAALDLLADADLARVRAKSMALGDLLLHRVRRRCGDATFPPACPVDAAARGSQVGFLHDDGYGIVQALIARGVVGDFRAPNLLRFGLTPLTLRFADVWDAVEQLAEVMAAEEHRRPENRRRRAVT